MATQVINAEISKSAATSMGTRAPSAIVVRTMVTHTVTYFIAGVTAYTLLDYAHLMSQPMMAGLIRPLNDPWVAAGPLLQPLRGVLFGLVFYMLRETFFAPRGWLKMWAVLAGVGIFGTFAAPPGSLEGFIYSPLPLSVHVTLLPEILLQSLALAWIVFHWATHPKKKWLSAIMGAAFALVLLISGMGLASIAANH